MLSENFVRPHERSHPRLLRKELKFGRGVGSFAPSSQDEVVLPHRPARELGFTLGDEFYTLYWDPEPGTCVM